PGQASGQQSRANPDWGHSWHTELHGPRTGGRPATRGRPGQRCLCPGNNPLRAPHGPATVPGNKPSGYARTGSAQGARLTTKPAAQNAARLGDDLSQVSGEGAAKALFQCPGFGLGPAALPRQGADPGTTRESRGAHLAVVSTQAGPGEPGGSVPLG